MKVGDRVRIIKDNSAGNCFLGWEGVMMIADAMMNVI